MNQTCPCVASVQMAHPHLRNVITRLTISSFSCGLDSAIITVSATSVWSAMRFELGNALHHFHSLAELTHPLTVDNIATYDKLP